jgi:Fuseless
MNFRIFRKRHTLVDLWKSRIEAFLVGSAIILFWRGIWALADQFLFPSHATLSAIASLLIGLGILIMSKNFVNQFIDDAVEEAEEFE